MRSLKQIGSGLNEESGQEVAKHSFGKTDARYWHDVIFKPTYRRNEQTQRVGDWAARIQWRGRRELFNLKTSNKAAAAAKAKDIYTMLVGAGWDATLEKFKPEMARKSVSTVGDFLSELRGHWSGKPKTFEDYCQKFRTILSQIFDIKGGREKFDYVTGGRAAWVAKIDRIKLADVTPERVNKWRIAIVRKAGGNPLKQRRARISCNSMMRQAKSLFASELLRHVSMHKPDKLPFDGVAFYERESMRYHSTVDIEALIHDAVRELPQEQLKIFLLATMAGLRRNEIDKLQWSAFRWNQGVIRIEATEFFTPKTSDGAGDVPIDTELLAMFRGWHAKALGAFVIQADAEPRSATTYAHYRAQPDFDALTVWLRAKGVTAAKPLHELRKEFGSQICAKAGIYVASRMLRHADIAITAQHYLDQKERVTIGMGNLLAGRPKNVTAFATKKAAF
ncbi:MAG TPA: tyrosine-type recombinase/integrase [Candidatus Dormibacteraeota bacterium]|nr:tyrosine-type recombinase/integrase [Candidatus Dormibacteraeota bacterium]